MRLKILPSARQRLRHSLADDVGSEVVSLERLGSKNVTLSSHWNEKIDREHDTTASNICKVQRSDESRRMSSNIQGSESSHP
jgi:hypothetical protein